MAGEENKLLEWTIFYVKNRDLIKREIKDYKVLKNYVEFDYGSKKHRYYSYPELNDDAVEKSKEGFATIVCLNTKQNIDFVVKNWDKLVLNKHSSMIFVDILSANKWIIYPHTHDKITEKKSLKAGLLALSEGVSLV